jgi:hypothetical protein
MLSDPYAKTFAEQLKKMMAEAVERSAPATLGPQTMEAA